MISFLPVHHMLLSTIDELPKMIIEKNLIAADGYFVLEHFYAAQRLRQLL